MSARKKIELEQVKDTPKDRAYYERTIWQSIQEFYYSEFGAESSEQIIKLPQNCFLSALEYARRIAINRCDLLKGSPHKINERSGGTVWNECYNPETVEMLAEIYVNICFRLDRVPSLYGFAMLTGIERSTLQRWVEEAKGVTIASRQDTPKKGITDIKAARVQSLQNVAISGGKGVVGSIAILNNELWNTPTLEQPKEHALSAEELPYPVFSADGSATWVQGLPEKRKNGALDALELPTFASADNGDI